MRSIFKLKKLNPRQLQKKTGTWILCEQIRATLWKTRFCRSKGCEIFVKITCSDLKRIYRSQSSLKNTGTQIVYKNRAKMSTNLFCWQKHPKSLVLYFSVKLHEILTWSELSLLRYSILFLFFEYIQS